MKTGIQLITEERERQIKAEGWTPEHDDAHKSAEMLAAGRCYAVTAHEQIAGMTDFSHTPHYPSIEWPWSAEWWKPSDDPVRSSRRRSTD